MTESTYTGIMIFALSFCRQRHIHHLAHGPLRAVRCHDHRPQARVGCPGLQRARRASRMQRRCAGARPSMMTSEPRGMAGRGGSGSEGVIGAETHIL